jgi:hypothetical protein
MVDTKDLNGDNLSALRVILGVEGVKFGETFKMAIPSQASEKKKV